MNRNGAKHFAVRSRYVRVMHADARYGSQNFFTGAMIDKRKAARSKVAASSPCLQYLISGT